VWHQGENDCFIDLDDGEDTSLMYETNLTVLIDMIRIEMHRATPPYPSAADIPVVIVMIHWPSGPAVAEQHSRIVEAQRIVAERDPRATFVETGNLKGNSHLNAGGLFVVGDRIAQQLAPLLLPAPALDVSVRWSNCREKLCYFNITNSNDADIHVMTSLSITWPPSPVTQTLPHLNQVEQNTTSLWREQSRLSPTLITTWEAPSSFDRYGLVRKDSTSSSLKTVLLSMLM